MLCKQSKQVLIYIRQLMLADGISITALGQRMGKTRSSLSTTFSQSNITLEKLIEITDALDYDLEINLISRQKQD